MRWLKELPSDLAEGLKQVTPTGAAFLIQSLCIPRNYIREIRSALAGHLVVYAPELYIAKAVDTFTFEEGGKDRIKAGGPFPDNILNDPLRPALGVCCGEAVDVGPDRLA